MVKRGNLVRVNGHYRTIKGNRVYIKPHTRWAPEGKKRENMLKHKKQLTKGEEIASLTDDEIELGEDLAYKQGYKRRSIKTSDAIYDRDPNEDEYTFGKNALLSLEEKQILERKDIKKKDIELGWKLTKKGKEAFSDPYYQGLEDRD